MEQEPNNEYEAMYLHLGEMKLSFTNEQGFGFTHDNPLHDHIYVVLEGNAGKPEKCMFLFRELFDRHGVDLNEFLEYMLENEFYVQAREEATDFDLQAYEYWKKDGKTNTPLLITVTGDEPSQELVHVPTPEAPALIEYGPTKERHLELEAEFIAYLLETNRGHLL